MKTEALTDEQRVHLIEEAISGPFDARTKIAFVQMVLDAGPGDPPMSDRKTLDPTPPKAANPPPPPKPKASNPGAKRSKRPHSGQGNTVRPLLAQLEKNGPMTTDQLHEATGIDKNRITGSLAYQLKKGIVRRPAPYTYELA